MSHKYLVREEGEAPVPVNSASTGKVAGLGANGDTDVAVKKKPTLLSRLRKVVKG